MSSHCFIYLVLVWLFKVSFFCMMYTEEWKNCKLYILAIGWQVLGNLIKRTEARKEVKMLSLTFFFHLELRTWWEIGVGRETERDQISALILIKLIRVCSFSLQTKGLAKTNPRDFGSAEQIYWSGENALSGWRLKKKIKLIPSA